MFALLRAHETKGQNSGGCNYRGKEISDGISHNETEDDAFLNAFY